jgi:hypothetical protein
VDIEDIIKDQKLGKYQELYYLGKKSHFQKCVHVVNAMFTCILTDIRVIEVVVGFGVVHVVTIAIILVGYRIGGSIIQKCRFLNFPLRLEFLIA